MPLWRLTYKHTECRDSAVLLIFAETKEDAEVMGRAYINMNGWWRLDTTEEV